MKEGTEMGTASNLLQQHFDTLVADNARWQTSLADEIVWELPTRQRLAILRGYRAGKRS